MNVLLLASPEYLDFVYQEAKEYKDHLIFVFTEKHLYDSFVSKHSYDIGVSFMWTHRIPKRELDRATWFNFHPAPLPEYKGRNLCYHAIMNGEKEFGATIHYMDENFDTGDIIHVHRFEIYEHDTAGTISRDAIHSCKALFKDYFPRIIAGEQFERLPNAGGTYYKKDAIIETVTLTEGEPFGQFVRAVTCGDFYPKVDIGGVKYKIARDE